MKTIKNYGDFCNWLDSKELDCEYSSKNFTNDTIIIFRKDGKMLNDDMFEFRHSSPPKSYNVLKKLLGKII